MREAGRRLIQWARWSPRLLEFALRPQQGQSQGLNVLVVGKAKTGTTIVSKTIQKSVRRPAIYYLEPKEDAFFLDEPFPAHFPPSHVVKIIFEHWNERPEVLEAIVRNETARSFDKLICIVRDPRDELISRLLYLVHPLGARGALTPAKVDKWLQVLSLKENDPEAVTFLAMWRQFEEIFGVKFELQLEYLINTSCAYYEFICKHGSDGYVLGYEDFVSNQLTSLEAYLGLSLIADRDAGEYRWTKRTASSGNWRQVFTQEDVKFLRPRLSQVSERFGYADWELQPCGCLNSNYYSDYVRRLVDSSARSWFKKSYKNIAKRFRY